MLLLFAAPKDADKEVQFQADNCSYGRAMAEAVCSGRVQVRRGDARLRCRSLTVRFGEDGRIEQLVCVGAVKFRRGGVEEATGERAAYTRNDAKVILQGEAKLRRGRARLAGDRVIFLLDEDKVRVEGQARGHFDNEER
jgi:lipopolysaccharide transport protein LptA